MWSDRDILRALAEKVMLSAQSREMTQRRDMWRSHNSLRRTPPPIYVRAFAAEEIPAVATLVCEDPEACEAERYLREMAYRYEHFRDDFIIEPWYAVTPVYSYPAEPALRWGPRIAVTRPGSERGAFHFDPPLKNEEDIEKLITPRHSIDENKSAGRFEKTAEWLDGIMPVYLDRGPYYRMFLDDMSTDLAYLRGLEAMMWDMCDRPEWLHRIVGFMQKGIISVQEQAESAGDYSFLNHVNQAMPYAGELRDPGPEAATRDQLWTYMASQEYTTISPAMWEEFLLEYQAPIMNRFGLSAYGCCEDLTRKIPLLKKHVKNLRRIAVSPWADLSACAREIGGDYVLSWRPNPSDIANRFDPERVMDETRAAFTIMREHGCIFDITLKDVHTVSNNPKAVPGWVDCVRAVISEYEW